MQIACVLLATDACDEYKRRPRCALEGIRHVEILIRLRSNISSTQSHDSDNRPVLLDDIVYFLDMMHQICVRFFGSVP